MHEENRKRVRKLIDVFDKAAATSKNEDWQEFYVQAARELALIEMGEFDRCPRCGGAIDHNGKAL